MLHKTKIAKLLLTLYTFGIIIWIGGSIIRTSIAFELYVPATKLTLKTEYSDAIRLQNVKLYAYSALYTDVAFGAAALAIILLVIYWSKNVKKYGWLFMSLILFVLSVPYEAFQIYLDIKLNYAIQSGLKVFDCPEISNYFVARFAKFSIWGAMSFLTSLTSIVVLIWRPLDKYANK